MRWGRIIIYSILYYILMSIPTFPFITYNPTSMSIYGYIGGMAVALVAGYFLIINYLKIANPANPLADGIKVALFFFLITIILDYFIIIKYVGFSYNIGFLIWYVLIILAGLLAGLRRRYEVNSMS